MSALFARQGPPRAFGSHTPRVGESPRPRSSRGALRDPETGAGPRDPGLRGEPEARSTAIRPTAQAKGMLSRARARVCVGEDPASAFGSHTPRVGEAPAPGPARSPGGPGNRRWASRSGAPRRAAGEVDGDPAGGSGEGDALACAREGLCG